MFMSEGNSKDPLNLLAGINSEKDDFGLYFTDRNSGYLGSNRNGSVGDDDIWSFKMEWDVKTVRKYNAPSGPVNIMAKDPATNKAVTVQMKIKQEGSSDKTVTAGAEGSTVELTLGDEITFTADGYEPVTVKVTEAVLDQGKLEPSMKALVVPDPLLVVQSTDAETGALLGTDITVTRNGTSSAVGAGQGYAYKAGDRLRLTAAGYAPVEMVVTEEMIASGKIGTSMMRESDGLTKVAVAASDGKGGTVLPVEVTVNRPKGAKSAGGSYTTTLFGVGDGLSLAEGDELLVGSTGRESVQVKVTRAMIRNKKISVSLKPVVASDLAASAASSYGPIYYAYKKWDLSSSAQAPAYLR